LYDSVTASNYETLKTLYPVWYRDVLEMDAIWQALGPHLDGMQEGLTQAVDNGFIWTADEPTITELEKFLYIPVVRSKAMIERKTLVASFSIGNGHIGEQEIKAVISVFTDGEIELALVGSTIEVSVTREISDRFNLADCLYILLKKIPAHLQLTLKDTLLPILFKNKNALVFHALGAHGRFFNRGQMEPVLLGGKRTLDGSWTLDQVFSGIAFQSFKAKLSVNTPERVISSRITFSPWPIINAYRNRLEAVRLAWDVQNKQTTEYVSSHFGLHGARQSYSLSGSVVINRMYELNGAVCLNGSRKLNAEIIKEEV